MAGMLTYKQMRDLVLLHTNRTDKSALVGIAINLAITKLPQVPHEWRELFRDDEYELTTNSTFVTLASDVDRVIQIRRALASDGSLAATMGLLTKQKFDRTFYDRESSVSTGIPNYAAVDGGKIHVYPKSISEYKLYARVALRVTPLVNDDDRCQITGVDEAIVAWATHYVYASIQETNDAQFWLGRYNLAMTSAIHADQREPATQVLEGNQPAELSTAPWMDPFAKNDQGQLW